MAPAGDNFTLPFPQSPLPVAVDLFMFGNWVEVTRLANSQAGVYARDKVTVARGRTAEGPVADPTRINLTLNDRDGRFTPRNPTGPYFGQIGRNTPVRVRVGNDVRGTAEMARWAVQWTPGGQDVWVQAEAAGVLQRLGQSGPLKSAPARYIPGTAPDAYWTMEDGTRVSAARPSAGLYTLRGFIGTHPSGGVVTAPQWGTGDLAPWLPPVLSRDGGSTLTAVWGRVVQAAFTTTWTVDLMYKSGTDAAVTTIDVNPSYLGGAAGWPQVILTPSANLLQVTMNAEPEVDATVTGLFNAQPHHIRWTATQSATKVTWTVYVDGAAVNTSTTAGVMTLTAVQTVGLVAEASAGTGLAQAHLAIWSTPPTLADAVSAAFGWDGETATARMTRLCAEQGLPFTVDDFAPSPVFGVAAPDPLLVGPQRPAPLIELCRAAAAVDGGILFEPRDSLGLAYRTAASLYNQGQSYNGRPSLTLDYPSGGEVAPPLEPVEDDQRTRNDVTVTRAGGADYTATLDDGSRMSISDPPDGVGRYPASETVDAHADTQLADQAWWRVHLGTVDEPRYPRVVVNLANTAAHGKTALAAQAGALDVGGLVTITNPPAWLPPDDITQLAQGFVETLAAFERVIEINGVPASPWTVGVYDNAFNYSSDGSTLTADIDATTTSFQVSTPSGPLWMTLAEWASSGTAPFNIRVGGEVMLVDANGTSGSTSPQTFTVHRSINGVVKSHPAGEAVTLDVPAVYAL